MPPPNTDIPGVWQVTLVQELFSQQVLNVLHYYNTDGEAFVSTMAEAIFEALNAPGGLIPLMQSVQSDQLRWLSCNVQQVWPTRLSAFRYTEGLFEAGLLADPAMASNVAGVITKLTDFSGRDQRGSLHIAGMTDPERIDDEWSNPTLALMDSIGEQVVTSIPVGGVPTNLLPILWAPGTPTVRSELTGWWSQRTIRVMRRRTKGVGR